MSTPKSDDQAQDVKQQFDALVADILADQLSLFDVLGSAPEGDYWAHAQARRLGVMLLTDPRVKKKLDAEWQAKAASAGVRLDHSKIEKDLNRKNARRRLSGLVESRTQALNEGPYFLSGDSFELRLEQYIALLAHVERLWFDAAALYKQGNYPIAAFLSILVIEEVGKLANLGNELVFFDAPPASTRRVGVERSHSRKHFVAVVSGALINARIDRVLGKDTVRKILNEAEQNGIERTRQQCLYIDIQQGIALTPSQCVSQARALELAVLAGELMAEVLGHFPWEFKRMIENVIEFERFVGLPEKQIAFQPTQR